LPEFGGYGSAKRSRSGLNPKRKEIRPKERKTAGRKIAVGQGPQKSNIRLSSKELYRRIKEFSSTKYAKIMAPRRRN